MKYNILALIFLAFLFSQCHFEIEGEIQHIYKLSSPNQQIDLYECSIESPMSFGSGKIEKTILKANEKYNPRKSGNFPNYIILGWIGNDTLKVIKFHKKREKERKIAESKLHEMKKYKDFYLDIDHRTSSGGGRGWFNFDTLYFTRDSIYFLQFDSLARIENELGLLKGQIRLSIDNDTVKMINAAYYVRIEDYFPMVKKGNELGYPYMNGTDCEITPNYRLESSIFRNQSVIQEISTKAYK